jgi:hypothetical protein
MLPTILCLPKTGEPVHPGREAIDEMRRRDDRLVCLMPHNDDHNDGTAPEWLRPLVLRLASEPQIVEAFRSTVRTAAWHSNVAVMPRMTFLLRQAEEVAASLQQRIADSDSEH